MLQNLHDISVGDEEHEEDEKCEAYSVDHVADAGGYGGAFDFFDEEEEDAAAVESWQGKNVENGEIYRKECCEL